MRHMLRGKIHRATVTSADLHYEGSVTIDRDLMSLADILPNEVVHVWNVTNGERFETYAVPGESGSGIICVNGAAAHKVCVDDLLIIAAFTWISEAEAAGHDPHVVFVDAANRAVAVTDEIPGPGRRTELPTRAGFTLPHEGGTQSGPASTRFSATESLSLDSDPPGSA